MTKSKAAKGKAVRIISAVMTVSGILFTAAFVPSVFTLGLNTGTLGGVAIGAAVFFTGALMPGCISHTNKAVKVAYRAALCVFCALCLYAVILSALMLGAMTDYPESADNRTVVVLGCQVNSDGPSLMLSERLETAEGYLYANPSVPCVVSGGKGDNEHISEAQAMHGWLCEKGVEPSRIIMEDTSTSTYENLLNTRKILTDSGQPLDIIIVTDGFHQWRAAHMAHSLGYETSCISSATPVYLLHVYWVREWFAISKLLFFGF